VARPGGLSAASATRGSGIGREIGKHGVEDFLESKSVYLNLG
jgi:acyl-CoA reductase-like NAD-dependent aldehyde dehydrogenase